MLENDYRELRIINEEGDVIIRGIDEACRWIKQVIIPEIEKKKTSKNKEIVNLTLDWAHSTADGFRIEPDEIQDLLRYLRTTFGIMYCANNGGLRAYNGKDEPFLNRPLDSIYC